jgi:hypothetical protein
MGQQQHPGAAGYPANAYGYPYYYGAAAYGSPYSAPGYQQSPCEWMICFQSFSKHESFLADAAYQYNQSALQGLGQRPGAYQQQQPAHNAAYRGSIPGPANYAQQSFYQGYPQQAQPPAQERDRSYKNSGFSDF